MLERLWTSILDLIAQFVTPDWGRIIGLLPVVILVLTIVVLLRLFLRLMRAPKARRDILRTQRKTPAGIHMPGPSFAPVFAAVGMFLLLLGLVFGGPTLILGAIALVLTLLYWLGEGLRLYDRDVGPTRPVVAVAIAAGPPPGVHMPGPSWRPFLGAFGVFLLLLGLVFGGLLLAVGVIALISTLIGWLFDAIREYRLTVQADSTGHLENAPPPNPPSRLLGTLIVLVVAAVVLQSGVFGTGSANGNAGSAGASGAPASGTPASGMPASGGGASGAPPASGPTADVRITAQDIAFLEKSVTAPAAKPFTIAFSNQDAGTPHDVELKDASGAIAWKGDIFNGVETRVYQVPALPAGTYTFLCIVHQNMTGTATLQ
jgi:plastocyanin